MSRLDERAKCREYAEIAYQEKEKPTRCISPCTKICQCCEYGWVKYPNWVETREDLDGCTFESGCVYGLEHTEPTEEELKEFDEWCNRIDK